MSTQQPLRPNALEEIGRRVHDCRYTTDRTFFTKVNERMDAEMPLLKTLASTEYDLADILHIREVNGANFQLLADNFRAHFGSLGIKNPYALVQRMGNR